MKCDQFRFRDFGQQRFLAAHISRQAAQDDSGRGAVQLERATPTAQPKFSFRAYVSRPFAPTGGHLNQII